MNALTAILLGSILVLIKHHNKVKHARSIHSMMTHGHIDQYSEEE